MARAGRLCGLFPHLANRVRANDRTDRLFKRLAEPLMAKSAALEPERIITECLRCRLEFMQLTDIPVAHPLEVIVDHLGAPH